MAEAEFTEAKDRKQGSAGAGPAPALEEKLRGDDLAQKLRDAEAIIRSLQEELAVTNGGLVALTLELEQRVDARTSQLREAHGELQRTNSQLVQLTLELEDRVGQRTQELRKLNDELEQRVAERTAELEAFTYSVAHDLRSPLRGIDGFSLALAEDYKGKLDEQAQNYIGRIRAATARMGRLIDDLLHLSRISRAEVHQERVDLSALAWALASDLQKSAPEREAEFVIESGLEVEGDPQLLQVALGNLFDNAWKFTAQRQRAHIELGAVDHNGQEAYFIRDNGAGFDMAYVSKLFAPFQRLHAATEFPGTGIGLVIVARIVRKHGGDLWAEGKVGEGAVFYFTLGRTSRKSKSKV